MALSKQQRKALQAAKKDGKITAKESNRLKSLGVPMRLRASLQPKAATP